jgi:hypothetical protein
MKHLGMRQKLIMGEPLQFNEATGDSINKMLAEVDNISQLISPYRLTVDQLSKELPTLTENFKAIMASI